MYPLWEDDHLGVVVETPITAKGRSPSDAALGCHVQQTCSVRGVDGPVNCLELLAVHLALSRLKGPLRGKNVLVGTDNTATITHINRQGGLRSCRNSSTISSFGVRSI